MKKIRIIGLLLIFISIASTTSAYQTIPKGCILCLTGNNGWCKGKNIKACLDEGNFLDTRCLIGATKISDCKPEPE